VRLCAGSLLRLSRCYEFYLGGVQQVSKRIGALTFAGERLVQPIGTRFGRPSVRISSVRPGFCSTRSSFRSICTCISPVRPSTRVALSRKQGVQLDC
jgi:hypothetical protein